MMANLSLLKSKIYRFHHISFLFRGLHQAFVIVCDFHEVAVTEFGWPNWPEGGTEINRKSGQHCGIESKKNKIPFYQRISFDRIPLRNHNEIRLYLLLWTLSYFLQPYNLDYAPPLFYST
jgi:hypothetical protein